MEEQLKLERSSLFAAVNTFDRFLSFTPETVPSEQLQLAAIAALWIASKIHQTDYPSSKSWVRVCDNGYTVSQICDMEKTMVTLLDFRLNPPTSWQFLMRFLHIVKPTALQARASQFYVEKSLTEYQCNKIRPSMLAAASLLLAIHNPSLRQRDGPGVPHKELVSCTKGSFCLSPPQCSDCLSTEPALTSIHFLRYRGNKAMCKNNLQCLIQPETDGIR